jgi:hypothetical protein
MCLAIPTPQLNTTCQDFWGTDNAAYSFEEKVQLCTTHSGDSKVASHCTQISAITTNPIMYTVCMSLELADMNTNCRFYWSTIKAIHTDEEQAAWCSRFKADFPVAKECSTLDAALDLR